MSEPPAAPMPQPQLQTAQLTPTSNHETPPPQGSLHQKPASTGSPSSPSLSLHSAPLNAPSASEPNPRFEMSAESPTSGRRKGVRGPGKKEPREKPLVSVRWEEGDLTERLIQAIYDNERWSAVFAQAPTGGEGFHPRPGLPGVPKRDLHREIARHLFSPDDKYDLDDKKVLEALAVSVKNKLFKIQGLFNDCKLELGDLAEMPADPDRASLTPDQLNVLTYIRDKFPQYFRLREILARLPQREETVSPGGARMTSSTSGYGQFAVGGSSSLKRKARPSFEDIGAARSRPAPFAGQRSPGGNGGQHGERRSLPRGMTASPAPDVPSLSEALTNLVQVIDQRNRAEEQRRYAARERWYERELEDRNRQREHEREMMRLRILLARARHGEGGEELEFEGGDEDGSEDAEGEKDETYLAGGDLPMG